MSEDETCQWCQESGIRHDASDYCEGCGDGFCKYCVEAEVALFQDEDGLYFCEPCFNAEQRLRTEAAARQIDADCDSFVADAILDISGPGVPDENFTPPASLTIRLQNKFFADQTYELTYASKEALTLPDLEIDFYDAFTATVEQCIDHRSGAVKFQRKVDDE